MNTDNRFFNVRKRMFRNKDQMMLKLHQHFIFALYQQSEYSLILRVISMKNNPNETLIFVFVGFLVLIIIILINRRHSDKFKSIWFYSSTIY